MSKSTKSHRLIITSLFAFILFGWSNASKAQEQTFVELKEFKITIEQTKNGLKMKSLQGSAWVDLNFTLATGKTQAIDEYGMTHINKVSTDKDPKLADFLFTVTKTKDGIALQGIEGTAWKELRFPLQNNGKLSIDQFGMND